MCNLATNNLNNTKLHFCSQNREQATFNVQNRNPYWINTQPTHTDSFTKENEKLKLGELNTDTATNATGVAALLRGVQWLIEKASNFFANLLMKGKEFASEVDVKKVAAAMKKDNGLSADIHFIDNNNKGVLKGMFPGLAKELDTVANGGNAFYTSQGNFAVALI